MYGAWCRSLIPVLVMGSLAYAQFGFQLRFEAQRKAVQRGIKDRIRKGIPMEELTVFRMPLTEWRALQWVKPGREFRLASGDMYDVVHLHEQDGRVEAHCVHDVAETHLFAGLKEHVLQLLDGGGPATGSRAQVAKLVLRLHIPPEPFVLPPLPPFPFGFLPMAGPTAEGCTTPLDPPPRAPGMG